MKAVRVKYVVQTEFAEQNKKNIRRVMDKLKEDPIEGMLYSSYVLEDGQTFLHINMAKDGETLNKLNDLKEFQEFRSALKESAPISPPKSLDLNLVGANFEL